MISFLRKSAFAVGLILTLAGCIAPTAGGPGAAAEPKAAVQAEPRAVSAVAPAIVDSTAAGQEVAMRALLGASRATCVTSADLSLMAPSDGELAEADLRVASGADAKGRPVGKAPVIRAKYPAAREVAETADGLQLFLVGTIDGRESAATFIGFPTPAGNAVWMKASLSYVSTCE